jgi:hypothetical protein
MTKAKKKKKPIKTKNRSKAGKETPQSPSKADRISYKEVRTERIEKRQLGRKA